MKARNKEEAIRELTEILYKEGKIFDKELFVKDVYLREAEGQTGLGNHIAIPHGKSDAVQVTSIIFGRTIGIGTIWGNEKYLIERKDY